jgi:oligopeptide/dipeptide ABC transporter ATP-binding protein
MYLGKIVELAERSELFSEPLHPYTKALLSAVPVPDPQKKTQRTVLQGDVPSPIKRPNGCHFHTRCPVALERCKTEAPTQTVLGSGRMVTCHLLEV